MPTNFWFLLSWTAEPAFVKIAHCMYAGTESLLLASAPAGADWKPRG